MFPVFTVARVFLVAGAVAFFGSPAHANSGHGGAKPDAEAANSGPPEFHARLKPLSVPGVRKGRAKTHVRYIPLHLVAVTGDEGNLTTICSRAPAYRDALLTVFHATPVVLNRRGGLADPATLAHQVTEIVRKALGNELVTDVRLASVNVTGHVKKSITCRR